jgi:lipopolysaccharide/colanic/teichoic acid biosynthesis glycosyltransferase
MSRGIQLLVKRLFDLIVCTVLLICSVPLLFLLAFLVKLSSKGPVFYVQDRIGKDEKVYKIIKFRTMVGQPDKNAIRWTKSEEDRITLIGRFMRDYGLDELPQLINILKGDMSIIGPRSPLPQQISAFSTHFKKMFNMKPGVLSLAAISGRRSLTTEERYELHVQYVEKWSLRLDMKILWRSFFVVLRREATTETLYKE